MKGLGPNIIYNYIICFSDHDVPIGNLTIEITGCNVKKLFCINLIQFHMFALENTVSMAPMNFHDNKYRQAFMEFMIL